MYFVSSPPAIRLDLYLNADSYSSEAVKRASNDLLNFLIDDVEKILEDLGGGSIHRITINFIIRNVGRGDENFHQVWIETRDRAKGEWEITYYWRD
ncbi:MAG: hypothetical protein FWD82_07640 [Defluviitaleaceae bacterium]|nr:hypothetical protein [Defluviitaleaceae bacterium]